MAEITRRRTGEMLRELYAILMPVDEGIQARDALGELANRLILSDYEAGDYPSGGRRFEKIVRFATVDLVKAGWLVKDKGRWIVTEQGRTAFLEHSDPEDFYRRACQLYRQWKSGQEPTTTSVAVDEESGEAAKDATITLDEAEEKAWREIDRFMREMNPYEFQEIVASLLRAMGYHVSWVSPPGKDGGIDILAATDPLATRAPRIKVQVKRQASAISVDGLRSFMALLGEDDVGIFVSVGGFTRDAASEARTQEKRRVTLIDNEELFDLWTEYYEKLDDVARRRMPLRPVYFLAPQQ